MEAQPSIASLRYNDRMSMELIKAIRRGSFSDVSRLLDEGADLNFRLPAESDHGPFFDQVTPLMVAVAAPGSNADIVRLLLARGADPFDVSAGEVSATWYASGGGSGYPLTEANLRELGADHPYLQWGGGDIERLRLMLDAGGDPNESSGYGRTSVYEACSVGDPARLQLLIERGAQVGPARPPGATQADESACSLFTLVPLFQACSEGSLDCVKLITGAGFPVDFESGGKNALSEVGSVEVAEYLWDQGLRMRQDEFSFDAIDEAIEAENMTVLRFLLTKTNPETIQEKLIVASGLRMNPEAVRVILEMGAHVNGPGKTWASPLHAACWQGDGNMGRPNKVAEETIKILMEAGADPNLYSKGSYPLHEAVYGDWGSPTATRILLQHGANVDALNEDGETPLMLASRLGELECVQLLLEAGANRELRNKQGKSALDFATSNLNSWKKTKFEFIGFCIEKIIGDIGLNDENLRLKHFREAQEIIELLQGRG